STLYVGLDSDDQAVSGQTSTENRYDGLRIVLRGLEDDTTTPDARFPHFQYQVLIDSTGNPVVQLDAQGDDGNPAPGIQVGAFLKEGSTAGDPSDVDAG